MNARTLPRTLIGLEYKAVRYPAQLIETKLVATRLPADHGLRLAYERLLGRLDSAAGRLLADQALAERGRALTRRTEILEKAVQLEEKATERTIAADQELGEQERQAEQAKAQIQTEHEREAARLKAEREAESKAIERKAAARKRADDKAIVDKTQQMIAAERDRLDAQEARIEARVETQTAAPKAALKAAAADARMAVDKKADADRLAQLREASKAASNS